MGPGIGVNLRATGCCSQGGRRYMEDTFTVAYHPVSNGTVEYAYFGIFDGHGGEEASEFARDNLLKYIIKQDDFWKEDDVAVEKAIQKGFLDTHEAMWQGVGNWRKTPSGHTSTAGTTATICFVKNNKLYIGHVGDSGVVLGYKDKEGEWRGRPLTKDHKPDDPDELRRITNCGGKVLLKSGIHRVVWNRVRASQTGPVTRSVPTQEEIPFLAVARSLGDLWSFNKASSTYVVSPLPDVTTVSLNVASHKCLVFGTDGLWNVISPDAAVAITQTCELNNCAGAMLERCQIGNNQLKWINPAKKLLDVALQRWSDNQMRADNTSVLTVMIDYGFESVEGSSQEELNSTERLHVVSETRESLDLGSKLMYTISTKLVNPSPAAALCNSGSEDGRNSGEAKMLNETGPPCEDSTCHIAESESTSCSIPLTAMNHNLSQDHTKNVQTQIIDDPEMCSIDESYINSDVQEFTCAPSNCTAENVNNSTIELKRIEATSHTSIQTRPTVKKRMKSNQNSYKSNLRNRECLSSLYKRKMKRIHLNDRKHRMLYLKSRWSRHSEKKGCSSFTMEHKRKRSLSDDRSASVAKKKTLNDFSQNVQVNVSQHESNTREVTYDRKTVELSAPFLLQNEQLLTPSYSDCVETRSQPFSGSLTTVSMNQQDVVIAKSNGIGPVPLPRAQKRHGAREPDTEEGLCSLPPHHKRSRSLTEERMTALPSWIELNKSEGECDGELTAILTADNSRGYSPILFRKKRSMSHERKLVTLLESQEKEESSKSVDSNGCSTIGDDFGMDESYKQLVTCTPNQLNGLVNNSNEVKDITLHKQTVFLKHQDKKHENIDNAASTSFQHGTNNSSQSTNTNYVTEKIHFSNHREQELYPIASTSGQNKAVSRFYDNKTMCLTEQTICLKQRNENSDHFNRYEDSHHSVRNEKSHHSVRNDNLQPSVRNEKPHHSVKNEILHHSVQTENSVRNENSHHLDRKQDSHYSDRKENSHHSDRKENSCHSDRKENSHHSDRKENSCHSDRKENPHHSDSKESSHHSVRKQDSHHSVRKQDSHNSVRKQDSHHSGKKPDSHHSGKKPDSHHSVKKQDSHHSGKKQDSHHSVKKQDLHNSGRNIDQSRRTRSSSRENKRVLDSEKAVPRTNYDRESDHSKRTGSQSHDRKIGPGSKEKVCLRHKVEKCPSRVSGYQLRRSNSREKKTNPVDKKTLLEEARKEWLNYVNSDEWKNIVARTRSGQKSIVSNSHDGKDSPVSKQKAPLNRDENCSGSTSELSTRSQSRDRKITFAPVQRGDRKTIPGDETIGILNHKVDNSSVSFSDQRRTRSKSREKDTNPAKQSGSGEARNNCVKNRTELPVTKKTSQNCQDEKCYAYSSDELRTRTMSSDKKTKPAAKQISSLSHKIEKSSDNGYLRTSRSKSYDRDTHDVTEQRAFRNQSYGKSHFLADTSYTHKRVRSNSRDRKIISSASQNQRGEKSVDSFSDKLRTMRSMSRDSNDVPTDERIGSESHKEDHNSYVSLSKSCQQRSTRSTSREKKTKPTADKTEFSYSRRNEKRRCSPACGSQSHKKDHDSYLSLNKSCQQRSTRSTSHEKQTKPTADKTDFSYSRRNEKHHLSPACGSQSHKQDQDSYLSLSKSCQQRSTRSRSHEKKTKHIAEKTEFSYSGNEKRHCSPACECQSVRRSCSYDSSSLGQSAKTHANRRSQSLAAPVGDERYSLPRDREAATSFFAENKYSRNLCDDKNIVSSRQQNDSETSRNEFRYEKQWSKRRTAPSTHIGELRRSAAGFKRKSCGSVTVSSSRLSYTSSSVKTLTSVPSSKEEGRTLRSVTAAVKAEALPIAKKLRSSSVTPVPVNYFLNRGASLTT